MPVPVKLTLRESTSAEFPIPVPSRSFVQSISPSSRSTTFRRTENLVKTRNKTLEDEDIYASSRLSGYLFIFTAYCVTFVSTFKARGDEQKENGTRSLGPGVEELALIPWKVSCTFYGSLTFMIGMIIIVAAHFDGFLLPRLWRHLFKVGGKGELWILSLFMGFALFIVYCSTSSTGLGGFAGLNYNVYFSSWAGLAASVHTFDTWLKDSAKASSISERFQNSAVTTNYNWTCTLLFSIVTLLSLLDMFIVANMLLEKTSMIILLFTSACVGCCLFALSMNACSASPQAPWHKLEGLLSFLLASFWTWVVFRLTGINGIVNGPNNCYIGVWGAFYFSISTFGMWLKEHKLFCGVD